MRRTASGCGPSKAIRSVCSCRATRATPTSSGSGDLKLGAEPFQTREETSKYTMLMPDGVARQFNFVMEAKSVITFPSGGQRLGAPGFHEISGIAWSGAGKVVRVEVTTDGGASWRRRRVAGADHVEVPRPGFARPGIGTAARRRLRAASPTRRAMCSRPVRRCSRCGMCAPTITTTQFRTGALRPAVR